MKLPLLAPVSEPISLPPRGSRSKRIAGRPRLSVPKPASSDQGSDPLRWSMVWSLSVNSSM